MQAVTALQPGRYYHIYNRGNNREDLFLGEHDYRRFFELYAHHMSPVANTYAYCLMRNHFHLLLRIKSEQEWRATLAPEYQTSDLAFKPSQRFSNLFNAYTSGSTPRIGARAVCLKSASHPPSFNVRTYSIGLMAAKSLSNFIAAWRTSVPLPR
jgi:REP element-mobilizing transposase RayT